MNPKAVLYLRSSKDRSDASISAQRTALKALAAERRIPIASEYIDAVESGKSEFRPAFQQLLTDLKSPTRSWTHILIYDTSRLSRRRYVAQVFRREVQKQGVELVILKVPDTDPIAQVILESVLEAMDEVHSLMSKEKGLAGMRDNIARGFRAGGRAPRGYKLKTVGTGVMREGQEVTKSTLDLNEDAPLVQKYLRARATGQSRAQVKRDLNVKWPSSSLIGMEWNALTYAGATVWNQRNEVKPEGGYVGGSKYRPREDWVVRPDTHKALISEAEAEAILTQLQNSNVSAAVSAARRGLSPHLLTGLLVTPAGDAWRGSVKYYRVPGKSVRSDEVDEAVVTRIIEDFGSDEFIDALYEETQRRARSAEHDEAAPLEVEIGTLGRQIARAMDLSLEAANPAPYVQRIDELEARRAELSAQLDALSTERDARRALGKAKRGEIAELVRGLAAEIEATERPRLKKVLRAAVEEIVLDPASLECQIRYRLVPKRVLAMASPRGVASWDTYQIHPPACFITKM